MTFHEAEHAGIFYPGDKTSQDLIFDVSANTDVQNTDVQDALSRISSLSSGFPSDFPAVVMVPQAAWTWTLADIHDALGSLSATPDFELIVLLAPLHAPVMEIHQPAFVFSHGAIGTRTAQGDIMFDIAARGILEARFPREFSLQNVYFTEEPGVEYLFPVLARKYPGVPVLPLLAGDADGQRVRAMAEMLRILNEARPRTLFIIAGNLSAEEHLSQALEHATVLQGAMENGEALLPLRAAGKISSVATPWIEAVRRIFGGRWRLLTVRQSDGPRFCHLPETAPDTSHSSVVWHAAEILTQGRDS
ncbi:AmmeMemoRadiSam system protein B [Parasphaerochaeta coccoides]|uniref:AmmeMemoRadiSam system protein B n=1 Tax=Parasphaerochaeta coccoides (strain ATCC BAA-1237 / DSM 17374 / SPN1) TaxID=760011 RepID=F4GIJ2_PARC1|nr:AmmeMemoRadiSam system protein B [Parasphaerochaeta coccoides]AEC02126.1 hypothetical protein Spico_0902 [Parasphaerochaeta coccoides DSM 17374]